MTVSHIRLRHGYLLVDPPHAEIDRLKQGGFMCRLRERRQGVAGNRTEMVGPLDRVDDGVVVAHQPDRPLEVAIAR